MRLLLLPFLEWLLVSEQHVYQRGIELLAEGGDLVYTSTSMNPIENEAVVAAILRMAPGK